MEAQDRKRFIERSREGGREGDRDALPSKRIKGKEKKSETELYLSGLFRASLPCHHEQQRAG